MTNELEDMKQLWKNTATPVLDNTALEMLLQRRSTSAMGNMLWNLKIEALGWILLLGILGYGALMGPNGQAKMAAAQVLFLSLPLGYFYYLGWKNLTRGVAFDQNLRDTLQAAIQFWEKSLRLYTWAGALMLPVVFVAARFYSKALHPEYELGFFTGSTMTKILKALLFYAAFVGLLWLLIHLSYGRHLKQLRRCWAEMQEA